MNQGITAALRQWRREQARTEGVEEYRVFPNAVLDAIVGTLPQNKDELLAIKGIKEAKYRKYGKRILEIVRECTPEKTNQPTLGEFPITGNRLPVTSQGNPGAEGEADSPVSGNDVDQTLSVSAFLDGLNVELSGMAARVKGEVTSVDLRERVVYFTLKDSADESVLNCLVFRYQYQVSGVDLAIGDEVIVEGAPDIYKPSGRLSFKVGVIELCGEGALKKAYEALKAKFAAEGLFAPEKKRELPEFPERIALITSEQGAAIGDFTMNLGPQGFKVAFYPTSVEGKRAVFEVIEAVRYFNRTPERYDILVIVRGGGSLESLQAFNNEALVREVAQSKIPTLLGVGHEKDITLAALVADVMVSTPTATARRLGQPWEEARQAVRHFQSQLPLLLSTELGAIREVLGIQGEALSSYLQEFSERADRLRAALSEKCLVLQGVVRQGLLSLSEARQSFLQRFVSAVERTGQGLQYQEELLRQYDPKRVLRLGYSLVRQGNEIVRDVGKMKVGDQIDVRFERGGLQARVEKIIN